MVDFGDEYYKALGKFIQQFAVVEGLLKFSLEHKIGLSEEISAAIFSGVRVEVAMSHMRRVFKAENKKEPPELNSAFEQLAIINNTRNFLIHHGTERNDDGSLFTSNYLRIHHESALKEYPISIEILNCMSSDLAVIEAKLCFFIESSEPNFNPGDPVWDDARLPWLYKPPAP